MIVEMKASDVVPGHSVKPGGEYAPSYTVVDVAKRYEEDGFVVIAVTMRYSELSGTFDVHYDPDELVTVSHIRRAKLDARSKDEVLEILKYLPSNYRFAYAIESGDPDNHRVVYKVNKLDETCKDFLLFIQGFDSCGWTMDDYVIPRLASGLYHAEEVFKEEDTVAVGV